MIEESAIVQRVEAGDVWVSTQRRSTCGNCAAKAGCGSAALSEVLGHKRTTVRVLMTNDDQDNGHGHHHNHQGHHKSTAELTVGQSVNIQLSEAALLKGSAAIYALPVLSLLMFGYLGHWIAGDAGTAVGFVTALVGSVIWLKRWNRRIKNDAAYQPSLSL